jgi:hypothetical protein
VHVLPHTRLGDLYVLFLREKDPYAVGGVALFPPVLPVLVEPVLDERAVCVEPRAPRALTGAFGLRFPSERYLYTVSRLTPTLRAIDATVSLSLLKPAYIIHLGHADHFPSGLLGRNRQNSNY